MTGILDSGPPGLHNPNVQRGRSPMWTGVAIVLVSFAWFPHSLNRVMELGYDFPVYYRAAQGAVEPAWVYSDHLRVLFLPFTLLPLPVAFGAFYGLSVLVWLDIWRRNWFLAILGTYPMLLALELGQVAPILAWLCLSLPGSILAACFKPYLGVFVIIHALLRAARIHRTGGGALGETHGKGQPAVPRGSVGGVA
jgi:hypothetical protein